MKKNKLMTHLYYGDVSGEFSEKLALKLLSAGADIMEVGIPYSDPVCDGPVFQTACRQALKRGITPFDVFEGIENIRKKTDKPIYLTSYFGPVFRIGVESFLKKAKQSGVTGLIIPDLLNEEQEKYSTEFEKYKLPIIPFATVNSSTERLKKIISHPADFIYCISVPGVTGDRVEFIKLRKLLKSIKTITVKKIFVGFGIKTARDAGDIIKAGADGVIVGSAIAENYQMEKNPEDSLGNITGLIRNIKNAIN